MDSSPAVLKAVVAALKADEALKTLVSDRVFSDVPQNETFPYVLVEMKAEPFAADDFSGQIHRVRIHCYSRVRSKAEAMKVRAAVHDILDRNETAITLTGATLVQAQYAGLSDVIPDDNGKVWDALSEFELWVV